jgi:hypothetical protein
MSLAVNAHKAVHDALVADATLAARIGTRVYDKVPSPPPVYPYVVVDIDVRGDANTCSDAKELHATVHVWSMRTASGRDQGTIEAKTIGGRIAELLAPLDPDDAPEIADWRTSAADLDVELYRDGGETLLTEGLLTFTYLVDPEA